MRGGDGIVELLYLHVPQMLICIYSALTFSTPSKLAATIPARSTHSDGMFCPLLD